MAAKKKGKRQLAAEKLAESDTPFMAEIRAIEGMKDLSPMRFYSLALSAVWDHYERSTGDDREFKSIDEALKVLGK